ncbi:MAG: hypothetical protein JWM87_4880 [Candidatus Eremiobacteraeota bacterium]|nr:hypothetical protein [Candidatus Eremiobacteraeota bacterium]
MRHHLTITINGQPKDEVALATSEPLDGVTVLTLVFNRTAESGGGVHSLRTMATETDFLDGAYHFRRFLWWPDCGAGVYRARGVQLKFADGNSVEAPLSDEIVVEALGMTGLPAFTAR